MGIALQLLFTGLGVGSIYALVSLGFVLIYRFAQGDFAMLGAFSMVVLCVDLGLRDCGSRSPVGTKLRRRRPAGATGL